ncbi:hypothetical protein OA2633_03806 [Oceanicaulis sp. HTCC2633]|uniref:hypothetical protein n=1 Tax=Oceanicaulis sp. HTCC2633 TaxID=314254 RepID=UPI000066D4D7|nr:hypothetical protein [Oceanicaulis sp. HTCC2633]EAP91269.1 hypothetical protein OA2633_03806 [Oceanicaulis sp. HTCC2633]
MTPSVSKAAAGLILLTLFVFVFLQPASTLFDRFASVQSQKDRLERLKDQSSELARRFPEVRDIEFASVSGDPSFVLSRLDQGVRRAFEGFEGARYASQIETEESGFSWAVVRVEGRGDLIDLDEALNRLSEDLQPVQVRSLSVEVIGLRRPEDTLALVAEFVVLVDREGAE